MDEAAARESWIDAIAPGSILALELGGERVLLCNSAGRHYAVENRCTHEDSPLEHGSIRRGLICCPRHGVRFDLATGKPRGGLTNVPIRTFPVVEQGGKVLVRVSQSSFNTGSRQ